MKKVMKFFVICFLMISLTACGKSTEPEVTPTESISMDEVHTSVVLTLTDQAAHFSPTPEPTSTITNTVTPVPSNTPAQSSPTLPQATKVVSNNTANGCNDALYVSDVTIPDGTTINAGDSFTKTWSLKNTGTCNWDKKYKLVYISGEKMGASDTTLANDVNVGKSGNISVEMKAPTSTGTYYSYWQMADSAGNRFGGRVYVMIKVGKAGTATATKTGVANTSTVTATTAATVADTATAVNTATEVNTATQIPTSTETNIPVVETTETESTGG